MEVFKGTKKILASSDYYCSSLAWGLDCIWKWLGSSPIYLYTILKRKHEYSWHLCLLS